MPTSVRYPPVADSHKRILFERGPREDGCALKTREIVSWQALRDIPAGRTATYTDIARKIGSPKSVRAVAGACAANNIAVAIPCHRVVRNDGSLSGYRWGVERKRVLIDRETSTI
jgi:O-6-methylguanine DNA methyltransferase